VTLPLVKTMCARDCPDSCFLDVEVRDGVVVSVRASTENPVTAGITCPRALGDPQRVYSMDRVLNPTSGRPGRGGGSSCPRGTTPWA
jgi:anaerobic selenocysteine-containing dehydrogenase